MKYVALFRGINVGGKNKVLMGSLRKLFEGLGFTEVRSYIQSGNVVFQSDLDKTAIAEKISSAFSKTFDFTPMIFLRDQKEFKTLIEKFPFTPKEVADASQHDPNVTHEYLYFLDAPIDEKQIEAIQNNYEGPDLIRIGRQSLYFLCYESVRFSGLAKAISKEFPNATARNWKTMMKIWELLNSE